MKSSDYDSSYGTVLNEIQRPSTRKRKITGRVSDASKKLRLSTHELGPACNCKRFQCFENINETKRKLILRHFNSLESHDAQNAHLAGLITTLPVLKRRPRTSEEEAHFRFASFTYRIRLPRVSTDSIGENERDIQVCAKAFCSLHGITKNKLTHIQNSLKLDGNAPIDKRGLHSSTHRSLNEDIKKAINDHILSFKGRESHYGLNESRRMYLLL